MISPVVSPAEALQDGCTAGYSVAWSESYQGRYGTDEYIYYRLSATAAEDWEFDHFEYVANGSNFRANENPYPPEDAPHSGDWGHLYTNTYTEQGESVVYHDVTSCTAVFRKSSGLVTVKTSAMPSEGGSTTPEEETKEGPIGSKVKFNLEAEANQGYSFVKWLAENGDTASEDASFELELTIESAAKAYEYFAIFGNGKILHGSSGTILHGSGGTILFKG